MFKMQYYGIGRRKSAVAQAFIIGDSIKNPEFLLNEKIQTIDIRVNRKSFFEYFQADPSPVQDIQQFLKIFGLPLAFNNPLPNDKPNVKENLIIHIKVSGGGITGQKQAIYLALANAFCKLDDEFYPLLKKQKMLTQDSRIKERKKYGLKKARKAPQYSKR